MNQKGRSRSRAPFGSPSTTAQASSNSVSTRWGRNQIEPLGKHQLEHGSRFKSGLRVAYQQVDRDDAGADETARHRAGRAGHNGAGDQARSHRSAIFQAVALEPRVGPDGA